MNTTEPDLSIPGNTFVEREYTVAVTGDTFRWLVDYGNEDVLNKVGGTDYAHFVPYPGTNSCYLGTCMRESVCQNVSR